MPELKHEISSDDELRAYLKEHLAGSAFAAFQMPPAELARFFIPEAARAFESLGRMDGPAFAALGFDAILRGLSRMNALVRTHPFWHNTNNRATIYKLPEFCRLELAADPLDSDALWAAAILSVWFGRNDFGQGSWAPLCRHGLDMRWPIYAALTTHLEANHTEEQVVDFLRDVAGEREALPTLHRIATEGEGTAMSWAARVLDLLGEPAGS